MIPKRIIMHHSLTEDGQTVSWGAIRTYHMTHPAYRFRDIGYQFGVERVGNYYEVLVGRMLNEVGAHTAGHNTDSIGICVLGNFDVAPPPVDQWNRTVKLVHGLCEVCSIPYANIFGHRHFAAKSCPGKYFDMNKFVRDVMRYRP